jgi:hypothetical protein
MHRSPVKQITTPANHYRNVIIATFSTMTLFYVDEL